ncbi:MAG: sulfatase-like hydrolase/transferase [Gammaproteobacteria bacterium]|nr:sulfatase-like hydrolase/transferase [Gammaproteobacteria bacterium]
MKKWVLLLLLALIQSAIGNQRSAIEKPNIILILADDVGIDAFGDYIGTEYSTPNIDRMGELGMRFENCYSQPLCTPSRVKIMTGQYNFRNYTHFGYMNPADKTFGNVVQEAGYKTAIAGKWQLNGVHNHLPGWDDMMRPHKAGFDEYMLWQVVERGDRYWDPAIALNGKQIPPEKLKGKYGPDLMSDFVCDFVRRHKDDPFFVYYPTVLPHSPFHGTPDSVKEKTISRKDDEEGWRRQQKRYFVDMVAYLDKIVGKIIRAVEETGVAEETIILFAADNGTSSKIQSVVKNGGGTLSVKGGKGDTPELGTHVPFYVLWNGTVKPGAVSEAMIDFTDFYATFAELAGVDISNEHFADGVSFASVLHGEKTGWRDWVQCTYTPYFGGNTVNRRFVCNREYKLYADGRFYHVSSDLLEEKPLKEKNAAYQRLQNLMDQFPKLNRTPAAHQETATERDIFPDWQMGNGNSPADRFNYQRKDRNED